MRVLPEVDAPDLLGKLVEDLVSSVDYFAVRSCGRPRPDAKPRTDCMESGLHQVWWLLSLRVALFVEKRQLTGCWRFLLSPQLFHSFAPVVGC